MHLFQHMPDELHLSMEFSAVQIEEVPLNEHPDHVPDGK
jgi:hypothetical protein